MPAFTPRRLLPILSAFPSARRCWIAYSGGLDSEVLLDALAALRGEISAEIQALHLDHGLHPDSPAWSRHCARSCARLGVPLTVRRLELVRKKGESLEAQARDARYGALAGFMEDGDLLLTAQHRDDQAETLLLALMRGSGLKGLAAMPSVAPIGPGFLVRPLLEFSRTDLLTFARAGGLTWVEDPSNRDLGFDRNLIRHRVMPLLQQRWPGCSATLARTAGHCAEAQQLIDGLADATLARVAGERPGTLSVRGLKTLDSPLLNASLRHWITGLGLPAPDSRRLERICAEVIPARADATPLVHWTGCDVRRYRDELFAIAPLPDLPGLEAIPWQRGPLGLPSGFGSLLLLDASGRVMDPVLLDPEGLSVRFGVTGAACRPRGNRHRRCLKKLYQEAGVPPWLRPYVPLVFQRGDLVAIGDFWACGQPAESGVRSFEVSWTKGLRDHSGFPD